MKKLLYILFCLFSIAFSSCKKNLLDSAPLDKYSDMGVWKDSVLVNLYVNNIYAGLPSEYDHITSFDMLSNYTDESTNNRTFSLSFMYDQNQNNASDAPFNSLYGAYYSRIRSCNVFLDNIGGLNASNGLKTRLTGEVRFLRALYYHYIYNYFGRFPLLKSKLNLNDNLYVPRANDAECIDYITSELSAAAAILPLKYTGGDVGRATKGAALALQCRTYLYAGQWQKAVDAANAVMTLNTYSLFPDYAGMFYPQNDNNSEIIFDKQYIPLAANTQYSLIDYNSLPISYTGRSGGMINPSGNIADAYEMKDGTAFSWSNPAQASNPFANRDPRYEATITHDGSVLLGLTVDMKIGSTSNPSSRPAATGYYMRKFVDPAYDYKSLANQSGQNFPIIRYAEVLLNYAEAQYNLGNTEEARKYVNMVRARPSVNMPAITAANFSMGRLRNERFVELAFEGLRLWDINRWKIGPATRANVLTGITVTGNGAPGSRTYTSAPVTSIGRVFLDKMYLFPIPFAETQKYPAGTPLDQNPGW